jgi:hypothetical protein
VAGKKAVLRCESGTSNPTSNIVWRYKGKRLAGADQSVRGGEFGGNVTTNLLEVDVTPEHHGTMFICEAKNEALGQSVHDAMTISVKCKFVFLRQNLLLARKLTWPAAQIPGNAE